MVVGDISTGTEVLVIGGGPGGYVAAIRAAQEGRDVTLVERDAYGGTCLNYGCIPSKAYVHAADLAHDAGKAEHLGVHADPVVDLSQTREWKDGVVDQLTGGIEKLCEGNGVTLVDGEATFTGDRTVRVAHSGDGRGSETMEFDTAVISTGSRALEISEFAFGDDPVWSSRDALAAETLPDRLVVIGAGYIGMELSTIFAKWGVNVTVVETLDSALPQYESDITQVVRDRAEKLGVTFNLGEEATEWRNAADGGIQVVTETDDGEESVYPSDRVLVAVGRQPVTDALNPEAAGIDTTEQGFVETDDHARSQQQHIYAVGDVAGEPMLAHKASKEGIVAAEHIAGNAAALDYQAIPSAVFTDPEIATVGMTADEALEQGFEPVTGEMRFRGSGRALTADESAGFVRVIADTEAGFVLGGQIVGPNASELIAEVTLAIEMGATIEDVGATIHTHPTLSEAVMEAMENAREKAIHSLNR